MNKFSSVPDNYQCPFCMIMESGIDDKGENRTQEIVYHDDEVTAFIASHWWPDVNGAVLVIPNHHYENIFDIPDELVAHIAIVGKKIAKAMIEAYGCEGVSTRQHNMAGNQSVWHYHLQVLPRNKDDKLYQNHDKKYFVQQSTRISYAEKLKSILST